MGNRNYPKHSLQDALTLAQKIQDEMAGKPMKRLLLADALSIKPSSTNFRDLLSSSNKYGLCEGNEKSNEIKLTQLGIEATQNKESSKRIIAMRRAALTPPIFAKFYNGYAERKLPSSEMMKKLLMSEYAVKQPFVEECYRLIHENGRFVGIIRDVGGSPHVMLDGAGATVVEETEPPIPEPEAQSPKIVSETQTEKFDADKRPRAIFVGHGKKRAPLEKLQKFLTGFQIPYKVVVDEANLGRPISQKVKDTLKQCGSAILIFTKDEKFFDDAGIEIWRPSENVVYELGAASYEYEDRVVIFKEKGLSFPTNFQSIGYIEFDEDAIEAKTTELLRELIGFGLVKIMTP